MSTTTEQILLEVRVDLGSNTQRLAELTKQLAEQKAMMVALTKANAEGKLSADDYATSQVRHRQKTAELTGEMKVLERANAAQVAANKAAANSVDQLAAQSKLLTLQVNALSEAERNTSGGQALVAELKRVNDALIAAGKSVSDGRRSVGLYSEALKESGVGAKELTGGLKTAADKGLGLFRNELERGSGLLGKFKSGSDLVKTGLNSLKGAGEAGSLGFKAVASGIALTGIGLFVLAISAVVTYFTQTAEGGRTLKGVLAGIGAVLQVATDTVASFGKSIFEAVSNPKKSITELKDLIEQNIVNRFKAFAVIFKAIQNGDFKQLTNGTIQLATGITNGIDKASQLGVNIGGLIQKGKQAYDLAATFADREKQNTVLRREVELDEIKQQSRVAVLIRLSKDRTLSSKEQLTNLQEAGRIEAELTQANIALQQKELKLIEDKITAAGKGKDAGAFKAELAEKNKEIAQSLATQDEVNAKIKTRESVFIVAQRKSAADAAQQRREDAVKEKQTEVEQQLLEVSKGSAAELVLLQKKLRLAAELELTDLKKTKAEKALILATAEAEKQRLQDDFNQKAVEAAKQHTAATVAESNREYAEAQKNLEDYLNTKRAAIESYYAEGLISENEYQKQLNALDKAGNNAALVNAKDYGKDEGGILKKQADTEIRERDRVKKEKQKIAKTEDDIREAALGAAQASTDVVIGLFGEESEAGQAALALKKTLALAQIGIDLQKSLAANAVAGSIIAAEAPPFTIPAGAAYVAYSDALAIAGAVASAIKIAGFKRGGVPSETGGIIQGPGTGTSDSILARVSNNESIINANSTMLFKPLLSAINVAGGGAPFPGYSVGGVIGSPAQPLSFDGGLLARQLGGSLQIDYNALARSMGNVQIITQVTDINNAQAAKAKVVGRATLGSRR